MPDLLISTPTNNLQAVLYLSYFYKHKEMGIRLGVFWMAMSLADILSAFLAYGLLHMRGVGGYEGWRWLFLIEVQTRTLPLLKWDRSMLTMMFRVLSLYWLGYFHFFLCLPVLPRRQVGLEAKLDGSRQRTQTAPLSSPNI